MIDALLVPDDGGQAEDLLSNGADTLVRVTKGRAPVLGDTAASRVVDDLHCPAEFTEDLVVGEGGHVRVCPCVDGEVTCATGR